MKKIKKIILFISIITIYSCKSTITNLALKKTGIFDIEPNIETINYKNKEIVFIGIQHIGRTEYYQNISKKVKNYQENGYTVFYEKIKHNSLEEDKFRRKIRKIYGLNNNTYYDTINKVIAGKIKYEGKHKLINQPSYSKLKVNMKEAVNADVELKSMILSFEEKYGEIELDSCDLNTQIGYSEYKCKTLEKDLINAFKKEFTLDFRNNFVVNEITKNSKDKILLIYGKKHLKGIKNLLE